MQVSTRHIGLIAGILVVLASFLFFGRQQGYYQLLLIAGLVISGVCFLWILLGRGTAKSKLLWTGVIGLGVALNLLTESFLIDTSYRIYLNQHRHELAEINDILKNETGEIWIMGDSIRTKNGTTLGSTEKLRLINNSEKLGVNMIIKKDNTIYYGLWGFLDVQLGITFALSGRPPHDQYRHLTGNWYH